MNATHNDFKKNFGILNLSILSLFTFFLIQEIQAHELDNYWNDSPKDPWTKLDGEEAFKQEIGHFIMRVNEDTGETTVAQLSETFNIESQEQFERINFDNLRYDKSFDRIPSHQMDTTTLEDFEGLESQEQFFFWFVGGGVNFFVPPPPRYGYRVPRYNPYYGYYGRHHGRNHTCGYYGCYRAPRHGWRPYSHQRGRYSYMYYNPCRGWNCK